MQNIKFEITEEDIKKYLEENKETYQYCEALFVKYLRENQFNLTKEMLEILFIKSSRMGVDPEEINRMSSIGLSSFHQESPYMNSIQNLDLSGICHILIPTIRYYKKGNVFNMNYLLSHLEMASRDLRLSCYHPMQIVKDTLDDYRVCNKVEVEDLTFKIKMSKEQSRGEILIYQDFYDETKVKKIRKMIRDDR
ncbi:MAG: hypothetical protein PUB18_00870 [bacterium]|nr:hypothetical protein [bacterium]